MKKPSSPQKPSVHFIGIGGIGVSSLAQWFLAQNWAVSGSDVTPSIITSELQKAGAEVKIGHKKAHIPDKVILCIYTKAIRPDNPEFREAKRRNLPLLSYSEAVGHLTRNHETIAVSGAHGKSTTTALAALTLVHGGLDPTVVVGTRLRELPHGNFRNGKSAWLVLEADEYGRTFHQYSPLLAIVTTIDAEHLDTYKNLAGVKRGFLQFIGNVRTGGTLILNRDDKNIVSLRAKIAKMAKRKAQTILWYSQNDREAKAVQRVLAIPGRHNVMNALAVLRLAQALGISELVALNVFKNYHGSWRRFEYRGMFHVSGFKLHVYDDYAHHPTEIRATLAAFREKYPRSPIVCVYQPHQAERLKRLWKEFQDAFALADITLMMPTYRVAGRDKEHPTYNAKRLVAAIWKRHPKQKTFYLDNPKNLKDAVSTLIRTFGDESCVFPPPRRKVLTTHYSLQPIIVMMGAGNIVGYTSELVKQY